MAFHHQLLSATFPFLKIGRRIRYGFDESRGARLRVLLCHDISPQEEKRFSSLVAWLQRSWKFVDATSFASMISGATPVETDSLLLTFDDGFYSNRRIAETVLQPMGIHSLFFVVSEFVNLTDADDWREFVARNILMAKKPESIPDHCHNMKWDDLEYLLENGHTIGAHTANHARLSDLQIEQLHQEILGSADSLEKRLGVAIDHFAYTFGDLPSITLEALEISRQRFPYIYTGFRGNNANGVVPWAIRRDSIKENDSNGLVGAFLEGAVDWRYKKSLALYESWGNR